MSEDFMDRFGREDPEPDRGTTKTARTNTKSNTKSNRKKDARRSAKPPRRRGSPLITGLAVVLLVAGVGLLGYVAYQYFGTNIVSQQAFDTERTELRRVWQDQGSAGRTGKNDEVTAIPGDAIALLRIPAFGKDYEIPILEGTDLDILGRGVGHYTDTAAPGQIGNFAVAGHRITHGQPFSKLLELRKGDEVIVETRDDIYTYVLDEAPKDLTVRDTDTWVIQPVPGKPDARPTEALMTLTTCQDLFHSPDRSVGFAHLASTKAKP